MRTSQRDRSGWRAERNERGRGGKKVLKEELGGGQERRQGLNRGDGRGEWMSEEERKWQSGTEKGRREQNEEQVRRMNMKRTWMRR